MGFKIFEAEAHGDYARMIYQSDFFTTEEAQIDVRTHEILLALPSSTLGEGALVSFDLAKEELTPIASKIYEKDSKVKALFPDVAILQKAESVYGVFFS